MNFLTSVPVIIWIRRRTIDIKTNIEIFLEILTLFLLGLEIAKIENKINNRIIAINIWTVIVFAIRLLSTTILPNQAWKIIAINAKNDKPVIIFLVFKNFNELTKRIKTDNPAIAPMSLFMYSIQVW